MTVWQTGGIWFGLMVYAIAWFRGGRPERFGAAVLILDCLVSAVLHRWYISHLYPNLLVGKAVCLLVIGWLAFRSDRWWPIVMASALCLVVLIYVLRFLDPDFSQYAAVSAHIGLDYLIDLTLLFGLLERRLAGEPPAGPAAWAKAARLTAWRRNRPGRPRGQPVRSSIP